MAREKKEYHSQFRFKRKCGKYYVLFRVDEAHPRCTGVPATEPESAAVAIARAMLHTKSKGKPVLFGDFARDFVSERCAWTRRMVEGRPNRRFNPLYLKAKRGYLVNYILPEFKWVPLELISAPGIDEWLERLRGTQTGQLFSGSALDHILQALRIIPDEAMAQGHIESNPARLVRPFETDKGARKREPFTPDEIKTMFPQDLGECIRILWNLEWYAYFLMTYTCGLRPQETSVFMYSDWIPSLHGAIFRRRVVTASRRVEEGIKTVKRGMAVKAVVFSDRLEWVLRLLIERGAPTEGLFFRTPDGRPIHCQAASKHFKSVARRAGVELGTRTQCCLRHTYYTDLLKVIPEEDVSQPAGYTRLRKEYDHRKGVDFLRKRQRLRPAVNRLIA